MGNGRGLTAKIISRSAMGLSAGLMLACAAMVLAAPFIATEPTTAQTSFDAQHLCFVPTECQKEMLNESLCKDGKGCCLGDRCFVKDSRCPGSGSIPSGLCYARSGTISLSINLGPTSQVVDLGDYIRSLYNYGTAIAAVIAAFMIVIGGFRFLVSGDVSKAAKGKENIMNAVIGLALILSAYLILNTINPELISLRLPKVPIVKRSLFVGCSYTEKCAPCGATYSVAVKKNGDPPPEGDCDYAGVNGKQPKVVENGTGTLASSGCIGKSCYLSACAGGLTGTELAKCVDSRNKCRLPGSALLSSSVLDQSTIKSVNSQVKQIDEAAKQSSRCGVKQPSSSSTGSTSSGTTGSTSSGTTGSTSSGATGSTSTNLTASSSSSSNTAGYVCSVCLGNGVQGCGDEGPNELCCGGYCGKNTCISGNNGDPCDDDKACRSGRCQTNWGNTCSSGEIGMPCGAEHKECKSGLLCQTVGNNTCSPGTDYSWCSSNNECASGYECNTDRNACQKVAAAGYSSSTAFYPCNLPSCNVPPNLYCNTYPSKKNQFCTTGEPGVSCNRNEDCKPRPCTYPNAEGWKCNGMCAQKVHTCTDGQDGAPCDDGYDCRSGRCSGVGTCTSGGLGARCGAKMVTGVGGCAKDYKCRMDLSPNICDFNDTATCSGK